MSNSEFQETKRQIRAAKAAAKEAAAKEKALQEAAEAAAAAAAASVAGETDDEFVKVDSTDNVAADMAAAEVSASVTSESIQEETAPMLSEAELARIRQRELEAERKRLKAEKQAKKKALLAARPVVDQRSLNTYGALNIDSEGEEEEGGSGSDDNNDEEEEMMSLRTSVFGETVHTARPHKDRKMTAEERAKERAASLSAAAQAKNQKKKEAKKKKRAMERAERTEQRQQLKASLSSDSVNTGADDADAHSSVTSSSSSSSAATVTTKPAAAKKIHPVLALVKSGLDMISTITILLCIVYFACLQFKVNPFAQINKLVGTEVFTTWAKEVSV